jgi:hypothetical protein
MYLLALSYRIHLDKGQLDNEKMKRPANRARRFSALKERIKSESSFRCLAPVASASRGFGPPAAATHWVNFFELTHARPNFVWSEPPRRPSSVFRRWASDLRFYREFDLS